MKPPPAAVMAGAVTHGGLLRGALVACLRPHARGVSLGLALQPAQALATLLLPHLSAQMFTHVQGFSLHEMNRFGLPSLITRSTNDVLQLQTALLMILTMITSAPLGTSALPIRAPPCPHCATSACASNPARSSQ